MLNLVETKNHVKSGEFYFRLQGKVETSKLLQMIHKPIGQYAEDLKILKSKYNDCILPNNINCDVKQIDF